MPPTSRLTSDAFLTRACSKVVLPSFAVSLPWGNGGQPWPLPGIVEAENFDQGGPGVAFFDVDSENWGNVSKLVPPRGSFAQSLVPRFYV